MNTINLQLTETFQEAEIMLFAPPPSSLPLFYTTFVPQIEKEQS